MARVEPSAPNVLRICRTRLISPMSLFIAFPSFAPVCWRHAFRLFPCLGCHVHNRCSHLRHSTSFRNEVPLLWWETFGYQKQKFLVHDSPDIILTQLLLMPNRFSGIYWGITEHLLTKRKYWASLFRTRSSCLEHINRQPKLEIIIGTADRMREAWVLNGFIPSNQQEKQILQEITTELTFNPCQESHRLRSNSWEEPDHLRNPKVVVEKLTGGRMQREQQCWEETSLEYLREKGDRTGLTAYIDEIEERLIPIIGSAE